MGLARELVQLERRLREQHSEYVDLFARDVESQLATVPGATALAGRLLEALSTAPSAAMKIVLQALRIQHAELAPQLLDASFVATFPGEMPLGAFPTQQVVRDMLRSPCREIIALGYEFSHKEVLQLLRDQARSGANVVLICDRERVSVDAIREEWPSDRLPQIYCDRPRPGAAAYAKMHCKSILVDGVDLLITSANFTFHGLEGNIEFGVRLRGGPAGDAKEIFERFIRSGFLIQV